MIAAARAEEVARASYGRLLAVLAARTGDIRAAEDALADAFERALRVWPESGIPDNPEGWLVTVAKNRWLDELKRPVITAAHSLHSLPSRTALDLDQIPDKRLELMFVCAHPAIDAAVRTPLMLQVVLGFEASDIASAFAMPTSTMAQRLVRAKRRIKDARIPFVLPAREDMHRRLPSVLEAVYGAYAIDWHVVAGTSERDSLAAESRYLAILLATLLDDQPEAHGLAALLCLSAARESERSQTGRFVPLDEQDPTRWDSALIAQGESFLRRAHSLGAIGRFQLEAAIQSAHCATAITGFTDWTVLRRLHEGLIRIAPTLGAHVSLSAVVAHIDGPHAALDMLDALGEPAFQPFWATKAHLLAKTAGPDAAAVAYAKALSLTTDPAVREYLASRMK